MPKIFLSTTPLPSRPLWWIIITNGPGQNPSNHPSLSCPMSSQLPNSATYLSDPSPPPHFHCHCLSCPHYAWPGLGYHSCLTGFLAPTLALFQSNCHLACHHREFSKPETVTALVIMNLFSTNNWMKHKVPSKTSQSVRDLASALYSHFIFHYSWLQPRPSFAVPPMSPLALTLMAHSSWKSPPSPAHCLAKINSAF